MKHKKMVILAAAICGLVGFGCSDSENQEPAADLPADTTPPAKTPDTGSSVEISGKDVPSFGEPDPTGEPATLNSTTDDPLWMSDYGAFSTSIVLAAKEGEIPDEAELRGGIRETITLKGKDGPLYILDSNVIPKTVTGFLDQEFAGKSIKWRIKANNWYSKDDQIIAVLSALHPVPDSPENLELGDVTLYIDNDPPDDVRDGDEFEIEGSLTRRPKSYVLGVVTADGGVPPVSAYYGVGEYGGKIKIHAEVTVKSWKLIERGPEPEK